ncbi:type I secretion outer membrane protein, TolC family [Nereida ignava]|uniref:Type I secretion outer membrane protein, TolC family n=1 Tax=Nereida ignava TaxID=282199 RepID=A0A0U1NKU6_9RHOB|nr:type I secretion outer membrane protein, TolC family [Nereida ignava]SFJ00483.1 outer membrane protein, adhesin transport system [Nereida ignava DSM 16309]
MVTFNIPKRPIIVAGIAVVVLSGCMNPLPEVTRGTKALFSPKTNSADAAQSSSSKIITTLQSRQSVLPKSSPFSEISDGVLAANARTAEAELRAAKLRSQARSKNWLPTIGPSVSLTSLGGVVASLLVEQVLFDNGKKKAERAFAAADVEVAAVNLAIDTNNRVYTGLDLYLTAQSAKARARVGKSAVERMAKFEWVMSERVRGGVSNRADLQVIHQKAAEIRSAYAQDVEEANTALAELAAMSATSIHDVMGISGIPVMSDSAEPLLVMRAHAEKDRAIAEATAARAGLLPGLTLSGSVGSDGSRGAGVSAEAENGIGFGLGSDLKAIDAQRDAAKRQVAQAVEDSNRRLAKLEQQLISVQRQQAQSQSLLDGANANLDLFEQQYDAGQRPVMDVINVYEAKIRSERAHVTHQFEVARIQLEIAKELGLLADGEEI